MSGDASANTIDAIDTSAKDAPTTATPTNMETVVETPTPTPAVNTSSGAGEEAQRAIIEALRKEMKEQAMAKDAELAQLRGRTAAMDALNAATVRTAQPQINEVIEQFAGEAGTEAATHLNALRDWSTGLSSIAANQLESEMPLVVFAATASAKTKRVRELEEKVEEQSKALAQAHKAQEEKDANLSKFARQLSDMEELAVDRQRANTELTKKLEKGIAYHSRNDFSLQSSREKSAGARRAQEALEASGVSSSNPAPTSNAAGKRPIGSDSCAAEVAALGNMDANPLQTTIAVASRGGNGAHTAEAENPFESDPFSLANFVRSMGTGDGRFHQSSSSHALIGSSGNAAAAASTASTDEIAAHLRGL